MTRKEERKGGRGPGAPEFIGGGGATAAWGRGQGEAGAVTTVEVGGGAWRLGTLSRARGRGARGFGPAGPWPGELGRLGPVGPEGFFYIFQTNMTDKTNRNKNII